MSKIVVVGLSGESIFLNVDHFNQIGETVVSKSFHTEPGGKGYNQAMALKKMGANVSFITALGDDIYSVSSANGLENENMDYYVISKDKATAVAVIITDKTGENNVTVYRGINDFITLNDITEKMENIKDVEYLLLQQEIPFDTIYELIKYAYNKNIKVVLNPAPATKINEEMLQYIYLLTPNEYEAKKIFGLSDDATIEDVFECVKKYNIKKIIITIGSKGCMIYDEGIITKVDSLKVKAVDTTGAGDTFNAGVVYMLSEGKCLEEAAKYGCAAAGLSVTKKGVIAGLPTNEEIMRVLKNE